MPVADMPVKTAVKLCVQHSRVIVVWRRDGGCLALPGAPAGPLTLSTLARGDYKLGASGVAAPWQCPGSAASA